MGKLLRVDLSAQTEKLEQIDPTYEEKYIGGSGVAAAIFTNEIDPKVHPFDAANALIFSVGPFCGTTVPFCGRHFVTTKSPLTGILGEASAGGFWGKELKFSGVDLLYISGCASHPVYLYITNERVEIRNANHLWGKGTVETENILKKEIGDESVKIASIGIAGENLVKYAAIINENDRAAARCGVGAVMGSKKLKAIVVKGNTTPEVIKKDELKAVVKEIHEKVKTSPMAAVYKEFGTPTGIDSMAGVGDVPIQNFTLSRWSELKNIGFEALKARGEIKRHACFMCPVACTGMVEFNKQWVRWPEYETLCSLGSNLLVDDLEGLIRLNVKANDLGMDTISLGVSLAMFMEAIERGFIKLSFEEMGLLPDRKKRVVYGIWGGVDSIENLMDLVAYRQGIGNDLAEGVRAFCQKYHLPEEFETHVKGLEVPMHEPRCNNMTALDYATSSRGAFHCYMPMHLSTSMNLKKEVGLDKMVDRFGVDDAAVAVKMMQDVSEAYSAANGCLFGFNFLNELTPWVSALNAITGKSYSPESWAQVGSDLMDLKRAYNEKCGISKTDDKLSVRFLTPILKGGTRKNVPPMEKMLAKYYELRNWSSA